MAQVVMNRMDDRLIHGQVMTGWLQLRGADTIWIVDDDVANNPMMLDIFSFASPAGVQIKVFEVDAVLERLINIEEAGRRRVIVLAKHPMTFLRLIEGGYEPSDINYGAMANKSVDQSTTIEVAPNCSLTQEDIEATDTIAGKGIRVWIQLVPFGGHKPQEWSDIRRKLKLD
jgi:D-glucosaminate PTS system EIIB component